MKADGQLMWADAVQTAFIDWDTLYQVNNDTLTKRRSSYWR